MKILMKKRNFVKVEMEGLLGVKVPCLMPIRVKTGLIRHFSPCSPLKTLLKLKEAMSTAMIFDNMNILYVYCSSVS